MTSLLLLAGKTVVLIISTDMEWLKQSEEYRCTGGRKTWEDI